MPETGGPTTQSGTLYQNTVTAQFLGRLLRGALAATPPPEQDWITEVRAEVPEHVDDTAIYYANGRRVLMQAKEDVEKGDAAWKNLWRDFENQYWSDRFDAVRGDGFLFFVGEFRPDHQNLREICRRARGHTASVTEWWASLNQEHRVLINHVRRVLRPEHTAEADLHAFLRCIVVEIVPLDELERRAAEHDMAACNVTAHALLALLRDRVGGNARYRTAMDAPTLRRILEEEDGIRFDVAPDAERLRESFRAASAVLRQHSHTFGNQGGHVERPEVRTLFAWVLPPTDLSVGDVSSAARTTGNMAVLLDVAGHGKTVTLRDLLLALEEDGTAAVLAIKADIQLGGVTTDEALCGHLGLPEPLERCARRLAALQPTVILIDQIDALSLSLSRNQGELDFLLSLIARLRDIPGVRLVISCRRFDLHSDPKLRQLGTEREFMLSPLPEGTVQTIIERLGGNYRTLPSAAKRLLRTPLHLDLYVRALELSEIRPAQLDALRSLQDLYRLLWERIVAAPASPGTPSAPDRAVALRRLAAWMRERHTTAAPDVALTGSIVDTNVEAVVRAATFLASAGLLVRDSGNWSFLHQTFFDFIVARAFVEDGASLSEAILGGDQGLTVRPLMLQVLAFLRGGPDQNVYLRELGKLLVAADRLRPHLHALLLRWFGALETPSEAEWTIARRLLVQPALGASWLGSARGNVGWLVHLIQGGHLDALLRREDDLVDHAVVPFLGSLINNAQKEIAGALLLRFGESEAWDGRILYVLNQIQLWRTEEAVALFERMFAKQFRTMSLTDPDEWSAISLLNDLEKIATFDPHAAIRVARRVMDAEFEALREAEAAERETEDEEDEARDESTRALEITMQLEQLHGRTAPLARLAHAGTLAEALNTIAGSAPALFLREMLPWLEAVVRITPLPEEGWPYFASDPLISGYFAPDDFVPQFLDAFRTALTAAALDEDADSALRSVFEDTVGRLTALPYSAPQELLAQVYTVTTERHTAKVLAFLLSDDRRLELGADEQYESRQLITALYLHLSRADRSRLEGALLAHTRIKAFRGVTGLKYSDMGQLNLLRAIPAGLLSPRGARRLRELERKHEGYWASDNPPRRYAVMAEMAGPPVPVAAILKMTDAAWLRAMNTYDTDRERRAIDVRRGGPRQLAPLLAERTRAEPERFYRLAITRVPTDVDVQYRSALISGMVDAVLAAIASSSSLSTTEQEALSVLGTGLVPEARSEWFFEVTRRFAPASATLRGGTDAAATEVGCAAVRALERYASAETPTVPDDLIDLLEAYALELPMGADERGREDVELYGTGVSHGRPPIRRLGAGNVADRDPNHYYLNSLRGGAFRALTAVLSARATSDDAALDHWWTVVARASADPSAALRVGAIRELLELSDKNHERAMELFENLMSGADRAILLKTSPAYDFLYHGIHRFYPKVLPFIHEMLASADERLQEDGAKLACIGATVHVDEELADHLLSGPTVWRCVAASVFSANAASLAYGTACIRGLTRLLEDPDDTVLERVGGVFSRFSDVDLYAHRPFLDAYLSSRAPWLGWHGKWAQYLLETAVPLDPEWTLTAITQVLDTEPPNETNTYDFNRANTKRRPFQAAEQMVRTVMRVYTEPDSDAIRREKAMMLFDRIWARHPHVAYSVLDEWNER